MAINSTNAFYPASVGSGGVDATAANQVTGNASLAAINGKLPSTLGQKAMAASLPVVIASDQSAFPVTVGSLPLPTGAATEATLSALSAKFGSLGQALMAASAPVVIASDQSAVPVSGTVAATQSGTWNVNNVSGTVSLPTGASTEATLSALNAKFGSLGQALMAASAPVVIASDQSAIPVSGTVSVSNFPATQPISAVSLPLPTGAATEATLAAASAKLPAALGQTTAAGSLSVVLASDQGPIAATQSGTWNINNISGTVSLPSGASTEATLSALSAKFGPLGQALMAASAPVVIASNQSAIPVSQSGTWNINNISGTISLPTGAASETTLAALNAKFGALGQAAMAASAPVVIASDQSAFPVTVSGVALDATLTGGTQKSIVRGGAKGATVAADVTSVSVDADTQALHVALTGSPSVSVSNFPATQPISAVSLPLPTGAATEVTVSAINGKLPATLGQKAMIASLAVVIASDQSALPVSQSGTWNINNISGSISLPTGAATEATLSGLNAKFGALGQTNMAGSAPVVIASDQSAIPASQSGTWNINNISGTVSLPAGAATETTLAAASAKLPAALGQTTMAGSLSVVLASNQSTVPVSQVALDVVDFKDGASPVLVTSSTNIPGNAGTHLELVASLAATVKKVRVNDTTGQFIGIYIGAAASEVLKFVIGPGMDGEIDVSIPSGTRISALAIGATAISSGDLLIQFIG